MGLPLWWKCGNGMGRRGLRLLLSQQPTHPAAPCVSCRQRYRCHMNCTNDPENCFSEKLVKKIIDEMASGGWKEAGYEYVNLGKQDRVASSRVRLSTW
eukprot:COSAG01_NODE_3310_length_6282_cov_2.911693_11_plen_98_part_00